MTSQSLDAKKLKRDLLVSYLMLSLLGVVLLLLGLFATLGMRDNSLKLIEQSAPRVEAIVSLKNGLAKSVSSLRAWMAEPDHKHVEEKQQAWREAIFPALRSLQLLLDKDDNRKKELQSIEQQLKMLQLWQWHIEDVVHTPGNYPSGWIFDSKISVLLPEITLAGKALVNLEVNKQELAQVRFIQEVMHFKTSVYQSLSYLKNYVQEGHVYQKEEFFRELQKAESYFQSTLTKQFKINQQQRNQIAILEQSMAALRYFSELAVKAREADNYNVAEHWLNKICLPAIADLNILIDRLLKEEKQGMQSDIRTIHWISNWVPWLMTALLLVMISVSLFLARKRTQQFIQPVLLLRRQDQLKQELSELTSQAHGVGEVKELCTRCLAFIAKHVDASAGAIYTYNNYVLKLNAGYALPQKMMNRLTLIKPGEGLIGQVYENKRAIILTDEQQQSFTINSSLLELQPKQVLIAPIIHEGQVLAVMELLSLKPFTEYQQEFVDLGMLQLGILVNDVSQKETIKEALTVSQSQAEELQAQAEELQAQTEELQAQTEELQIQGEELRVSNEELSNKGELLESQKQAIEHKVKELEESGRYKSEFLANMSHELRTPLNSLLLLAKGLADNKRSHLDETEVEDARIIYESGNSLLNLINDILDLSKVEAGKLNIHMEQIRIASLLRNIRSTFNPIAEKRSISFAVSVDEDVPETIHSDSQRLEQILRNLLANAMKFTGSGSVDLQVSVLENVNGMVNSFPEGVSLVCFRVKDTGIGIPESKQQAIFEAFQQQDGSTSRKYGGTGLGLTIAKELTRLLGGEIKLFSRLGEGSEFSIYLAKDALNDETESAGAVVTAMEKNSDYALKEEFLESHIVSAGGNFIDDDRADIGSQDKILLVIDDDKKFARILRDNVRENGYKCLVAGDGRTGIYLARSFKPQGILLDIGLPDIDGHQVLEQLKFSLSTRHIPVQVISAYDDSKKNALLQGAIGFLSKPVNQEQLQSVLAEIANVIDNDVKQILLIEDDTGNQKATTRLLENSGIEICCVASGKEGYGEIRSGKYDCVILDLGLPDMSGFDVLKQINESDLQQIPPIIVYTGRDISDQEQAQLDLYSSSIVIKGAGSSERLLDDVSLFLHNIEANLKKESKQVIHLLHDEDAMLKERKILLVDDDMRNIYALSKQLIEIGCEVELAYNGQEALDILENDFSYELVLMDTMMPVMDGNEATIRIRQIREYKDIPIIALTAKTMPEDRERSLHAGASEYLTKPIDFEKLLSIMRIWLFKQ